MSSAVGRDPLHGAIDLHVHSSPDVVPRLLDDVELAQLAATARMRAVVIKSHYFPTADRARLASRLVPGLQVLGGVVLNAAVGGLNCDAVRAAFAVGGRIVWLPTISAENHLRYMRSATRSDHLRNLTSSEAAVPVVRAGTTLPALDPVLDLIAAHDAVLATGHLAADEVVVVVNRALERGVRRIIVTHPEQPIVNMPLSTQTELANQGVFIERCYINLLEGVTPSHVVAEIKSIGVERVILSTDLGQATNPPPVDGMRSYYEKLCSAGLDDDEWRTMTARNPASLLGIG